jgi:hypothetical protein
MTTSKMNCSIQCPLDGTPRATLRGLLNGWRSIRLPGLSSTVQNEYRTREDLKKTDSEILRTDRQNTAGEGITKKPEHRTEKITSLVYVV